MPKVKSRGSLSIVAMTSALEELEEQMSGRVAEDQVAELFGARVARLREQGILTEAIIRAYARKAAEEDRSGLVDETEQARLILSRYDERKAGGRRKRLGPPQESPPQAPVVKDEVYQPGSQRQGWLTRTDVVEPSEVNSEKGVLEDEAQVSDRSRVLIDEPV